MINWKMYAKSVCTGLQLTSLLLTAPLLAVAAEESDEPSEPVGKVLMEKKCTVCHSIERVYEADKNRAEWEQTVEKMMRYSDQMNFLNQKEKEAIIEFLVQRKNPQVDTE